MATIGVERLTYSLIRSKRPRVEAVSFSCWSLRSSSATFRAWALDASSSEQSRNTPVALSTATARSDTVALCWAFSAVTWQLFAVALYWSSVHSALPQIRPFCVPQDGCAGVQSGAVSCIGKGIRCSHEAVILLYCGFRAEAAGCSKRTARACKSARTSSICSKLARSHLQFLPPAHEAREGWLSLRCFRHVTRRCPARLVSGYDLVIGVGTPSAFWFLL